MPQLRFSIGAVNHGFRSHKRKINFDGEEKIGGDTSGSCNVDVVCGDGDVAFGDLIDFYRDRGKLTVVDAEGQIDEVYGRLVEALA